MQLPITLPDGRCVDQAIRRSDSDTLKTIYAVTFTAADGSSYESVVSDMAPKLVKAGFQVERPPMDFSSAGYSFSAWTSDRAHMMSVSMYKDRGQVKADVSYVRPLVND